MAPGVACACLDVVRKPFFDVGFKRIVSRNAGRLEVRGVGVVADKRLSEIRIATIERVPRLARDGVVILIAVGVGKERVLVEDFKAVCGRLAPDGVARCRSEEHTSELQSLRHLVCRLLLEKKTTTYRRVRGRRGRGRAGEQATCYGGA